MVAHAGRSAFLAGAALWFMALSVVGAASSSLDRGPRGLPAETNGTLQVAQGYGRQPGDDAYGGPQTDGAGLLVRLDRLENQVRQLTGQIEQMQYATRKLEEQLRKFQQDVEFRFQEGSGHGGTPAAPTGKPLQRRSEVEEPVDLIGDALTSATPETEETPAPKRPIRRGDAFDPASDPAAPGAPRPLGSLASTQPSGAVLRAPRSTSSLPGVDGGDPNAPLDLSGSRLGKGTAPAATSGAVDEPSLAPMSPSQARSRPGDTTIAAIASAATRPATDTVREEFDIALGLLKQKEYEAAEKSFASFLQKNPKSKLASDAVYYLGESYFQRGRQREAAEQYLKISTHYASSPRAPEAFLRLGQSLNALGAREQACAAYAEIGRKYPNATASVKSGAEREAKRAQC